MTAYAPRFFTLPIVFSAPQPAGTRALRAPSALLNAGSLLKARASAGAAVPLRRFEPAHPVLRLQDVGVGERELNLSAYAGEIVHLSGGSPAMRLRVLTMAAGFSACGSGLCELLGFELDGLPDAGRRALREHHVARMLACDHLAEAATVLAAMALPLVRQGLPVSEARARAALELDALGYGHLAERRPETLDASESRLAVLARAMATRPQLLVLEDPETSLSATAVSSLRLGLWSLASTFGTCVLMSSSHPRLMASADRSIDLDGRSR